VLTTKVPMGIYEEIYQWFIYKAKEGRHTRIHFNIFFPSIHCDSIYAKGRQYSILPLL